MTDAIDPKPTDAVAQAVDAAALAFVEALKDYEAHVRRGDPDFRSFGTVTIIETLRAAGLGNRPAI